MKKYIKIIGLFIFALTFSGCDEFLEEEPESLLSQESFYKNFEDLRIGTNGILKALYNNRGHMPGTHRSFQMHLGADDLTTQPTTKTQWTPIDQYNIAPSQLFFDVTAWQLPYQVIKQANNIIEIKDQIPGNQDEINEYVAIAHFWRGWAHFYASRFFGDIPIITSTVGDFENETRDPVLDVYKQIESDLLEAAKYLPESWPTEASHPDAWAVKTLLADFYITWAGWPIKDESKYAIAASYAEDVMLNSGAELLDDYADLWKYDDIGTYDSHKETIFEMVFVTNAEVSTNGASRPGGRSFVQKEEPAGFADFFCEIGFFNRFPEGYRKDVTFKTEHNGISWENSTLGHPYYKKHRGSYDWNNSKSHVGGDNFEIYRFADVLLLYAEAKAMSSGPDASSYEALNKVRRRANNVDWRVANITYDLSPSTGLGAIEFRDEVLDEKSWEFAAEQRRWYDLIRTEKLEWAASTKDANDIPVVGSVGKEDYLFPIPAQEILLAPGLSQNQGY
ncbi:RagB/SusD family nutrient uptake outer membrane protein [Lutibacter citreus]|uniref:RagB/SusD family nutrient uptake outer membrane protein n=1 Tax=Lutibacter citreus TaxID=2138210 RepID=UPI000DBE5F6D|nr:RagB/SusD family nutrient uptake outer membrane protein [Lutibacter citreus]